MNINVDKEKSIKDLEVGDILLIDGNFLQFIGEKGTYNLRDLSDNSSSMTWWGKDELDIESSIERIKASALGYNYYSQHEFELRLVRK